MKYTISYHVFIFREKQFIKWLMKSKIDKSWEVFTKYVF